jgi:HTH-type transcriptional regulator, transcriptional repressor of NAD biosynthesis genes
MLPVRPGLAPVICLLGGESTGKTVLAQALYQRLTASHGLRVALVSEHLRNWCEAAQRAPRAEEQAAIAEAQTRHIFDGRARPGIQLLIADTSALTIAAYSELYFNDRSLWANALAAQRTFDATLVMGTDLPWQADGLFRDGPSHRDQADSLLRQALHSAGLAYQTVYGNGEHRLTNALRALSPSLTPLLGAAPIETDAQRTEGRPGWQCEACSDPDCEHRLFTSLVEKSNQIRTPP